MNYNYRIYIKVNYVNRKALLRSYCVNFGLCCAFYKYKLLIGIYKVYKVVFNNGTICKFCKL